MKIILTTIVLFVFMASGCVAQKSDATNQANGAANANREKPAAKTDAELQRQIEQIASAEQGRVGVKAEILETGETVLLRADEQFPMQSVYKLPIAMAVLRETDAGKIKLDQIVKIEKSDFVRIGMYSPIRDKNPNGTQMTVEKLLEFAVSESDGTASDVLLDLIGGGASMTRFLSALGIANVVVRDSEKQIGKDWQTQYRNWASPAGAVELLRALQEKRGGLSDKSHSLLMKFLIETTRGQKRLKGLLPPTAIVAHKTGTSGTRDGVTAATNDIGIITLPDNRHILIAVFVSDSPADEKTREQVIAKIAKAAWDKWSR